MDAREVVAGQFKFAHGILLQVMAEVQDEVLHKKLEGSSIDTIASTFAHIVVAEETLVSKMCLGGQRVFEAEGWAAKTGFEMPETARQSHEWASTVKMDLEKFLPYAKAVFAHSEAGIAAMSDEQLAAPLQSPMGPTTAIGLLSGLGLYHTVQHSGEISALLGVQGLKGLPF